MAFSARVPPAQMSRAGKYSAARAAGAPSCISHDARAVKSFSPRRWKKPGISSTYSGRSTSASAFFGV